MLEIEGSVVLVEDFSKGTADAPELYFTVLPDNILSGTWETSVSNRISSMFTINEDIVPFPLAIEDDKIMVSLVHQLRGTRNPITPTVFEALVDSVIEQQISLKAAQSIENRLIRVVGSPFTLDNQYTVLTRLPVFWQKQPIIAFRSCGITRRKGEYIREISRQIHMGRWIWGASGLTRTLRRSSVILRRSGYRKVDRRAHHLEGTSSS